MYPSLYTETISVGQQTIVLHCVIYSRRIPTVAAYFNRYCSLILRMQTFAESCYKFKPSRRSEKNRQFKLVARSNCYSFLSFFLSIIFIFVYGCRCFISTGLHLRHIHCLDRIEIVRVHDCRCLFRKQKNVQQFGTTVVGSKMRERF